MSDKMNSIDQREKTDENKVSKLNKTGKISMKHTNCQSIPSTLMAYGHNQASLTSGHSPSEGKHHHHHHHNHGHHQAHVIHRTTSESLRLGTDTNNAEVSPSLSGSTSMGNSGASSSSGNQPSSLAGSMPRKPKTSSFQITSVTVGNKLSADNGDDSADDLDESHTDDNSRITDLENETPSFSEDTFSKEDVFFSNSALGTAPVIPTSSQYGLVIVDPDIGGVGGQTGANISNVHVSVSDAGINIVGSPSCKLGENDQKDLHHRNERFKVVKIESTEPFKRGRWMCMDYLDHSTLQSTDVVSTSNNSAVQPRTQTGVTGDSGVVLVENNSDVSCDPGETNALYNASVGNMMANATNSPGQTMQHALPDGQSQSLSSNPANAPTSMIQQSSPAGGNAPQTNLIGPNYSQPQLHQTLPTQQYPQTSHLQGQSHPAQFYQNNQPNQPTVSNIHGATLPSNINIQNGIPSNFVQQVAQQSQAPMQSTLPVGMTSSANCSDSNATNIAAPTQNSNVVQPPSISQPSSIAQVIPQSQQPDCFIAPPSASQSYHVSGVAVASSASVMPMDIHHSDINPVQQQPTVVGGLAVASNPTPQTITPAAENVLQQPGSSRTPIQNISTLSQDSTQPMVIMNDGSSTVSTPQPTPATASATSIAPQQSSLNNEDDQAAAIEADSERVSSLALALAKYKRPSYKLYNFAILPDTNSTLLEEPSEQETCQPHYYRSQNLVHTTSNQCENNRQNSKEHIDAAESLMMPRSSSLQIPSNSNHGSLKKCDKKEATNLASSWSASVGSDDLNPYTTGSLGTSAGVSNENSASGTSAVAIDNKIEQAMDLVKSHLMIAVREEVEVLKEKIAELMDRINQLELENTILKANVSQETLSQLSATMQTASSKQPQNSNNGSIL